jgi:hypothetical protein
MSSVTPPDGGYNTYYMKHLTDLEDELKKDHTRSEQRSQERVADVERKYSESIQRHDEKTAEAVEKIQEASSDSAMRSRDNARVEIDRLKRQNYDKNGRNRGPEADMLRQQLDETIQSAEAQHQGDESRSKDLEKTHARRIEDLSQKYDEKLEKSIDAARTSSATAFHEAFETDQSVGQQQRADVAKRAAELEHSYTERQQADRREAEKVVNESKRELENERTHSEAALEARLTTDQRANLLHNEQTAKKMRDGHNDETRLLRDKIEDLVSAEGTYMKERGQGKLDAVKEYENEWRSRETVAQSSHDAEIAKLKDQADHADTYNAHLNDRNLHDRDVYFTGLLGKTAAENREEQKDLASRYAKTHEELERQVKVDKLRAQEQLESSLHVASEQRAQALENQALAYQDTIASSRVMDEAKIKTIEKELLTKNSATDATEITPAVENAVRRTVVKQYEKNLNAETDRNKRTVDTMQQSYSNRLVASEADASHVLTKHEQQNQSERHQDQARFLDAMNDTELQKNESLRRNAEDHDRQTDNLTRTFSNMNVRQREEYESLLQSLREDTASKVSAIRQESEFASKTAQRAFSAKQNELIREYEKKLADQKTNFDARTDEIRSQSQQVIRDTERRGKTALDDQARGYEQRLTQFQAQQKEHERTVTQNYEDELEKVRRSNALIQQKKS